MATLPSVERLHALHRRGALSGPALTEAVRVVTATREPAWWRSWLLTLCLALGVLHVAGSSAYYAIVNWAELGRLGQIGLVAATFALAGGAALRLDLDRLPGKLATSTAAGLIGALLTVIAVAYDTGGDAWQLFAAWAGLALPFLLAARFAPLLLAWVLLLDVTVLAAFEPLYRWLRHLPESTPGVALCAVHLLAFAAWEIGARRVAWLDSPWAVRTLGALLVASLTATGMPAAVWEGDVLSALAIPSLLGVLAVAQLLYWRGGRDLFLAAAPMLGVLVLAGAFALRAVIEWVDSQVVILLGTPVFIAALLVVTVAMLAWLRLGLAQRPAEEAT